MKDENILYWLWLAEKCGAASKAFGRIIEKYDDPFDVYNLEDYEIEQLDGITHQLKAKLCEKSLERSFDILKYCRENRVDIISYGDKRYPERLKNIVDPPIVLYCLGHFPDFNNTLCIGIVGTRRMTEYGKQMGYKIGYELASADALVVSGMALGVDAMAAGGALTAGGRTVAVLGSGISVIYPKEHDKLASEIARHGAVITEYPPREPPYGHNFPKRNRIISGLSQGVLVVEASVGSGALITAKEAIAQGREVFALPGNVGHINAEGTNELIQSGAYIALCAEDILKHYDFLYNDAIDYSGLGRAKKRMPGAEQAMERYGIGDAGKTSAGRARVKKKDEDALFELGPRKEARPLKKEEKVEDMKDGSPSVLDGLDSTTRKVFECLPIDKAVSIDAITSSGIGAGDAITALTMLELSGLVSSLPGGLYVRK